MPLIYSYTHNSISYLQNVICKIAISCPISFCFVSFQSFDSTLFFCVFWIRLSAFFLFLFSHFFLCKNLKGIRFVHISYFLLHCHRYNYIITYSYRSYKDRSFIWSIMIHHVATIRKKSRNSNFTSKFLFPNFFNQSFDPRSSFKALHFQKYCLIYHTKRLIFRFFWLRENFLWQLRERFSFAFSSIIWFWSKICN